MSKGGTFVEATLQQPNYLPYITPYDTDKFYQSLLFRGCLYPQFSGTTLSFQEDLCTVTTEDYQSFTVSPLSGMYRSDLTPISINDIFFTYKSILKDNYRNITHLDGFSSLLIEASPESVTVTFPKASKDNMIFFTNFILPAHILANVSLEEYIIRFLQDPIWSACATIQQTGKDLDNYIFDLTTCTDFSLKNYQIKRFPTREALTSYVQANTQVIDFSLDPLPEDLYNPTSILLNNYFAFFFNTTRSAQTVNQRKWLAALLQKAFIAQSFSGSSQIYAPDTYLFATPNLSIPEIRDLLSPTPIVPDETIVTGKSAILLPESILLGTWTEAVHMISDEIEEKFSLILRFSRPFDRVGIALNDGKEYFPVSYNRTSQSAQYNLSPLYGTIVEWKNTYTIRGYEQNRLIESYPLVVRYLTPPPLENVAPTEVTPVYWPEEPFQVVYFDNQQNRQLIGQLQRLLTDQWREDWFEFIWYSDSYALEWKLMSKDYDIVLRTINFWLKKDLSTLLETTDPIINPSLQKNDELSSLITTYFLEDNDTQKSTLLENVQTQYRSDPQLFIIWKAYGTLWIRNNGSFSYPERLYVLWRRKSLLQNIQFFQHVSIDREKASDPAEFFSFIGKALGNR